MSAGPRGILPAEAAITTAQPILLATMVGPPGQSHTMAGPPGQGHPTRTEPLRQGHQDKAMRQGHQAGGTLKPQVCRHSRLRVETAGETESPRGTRLPLSPRGTPRHPVFLGGGEKSPEAPSESGQVCASHRPRCTRWCRPGDQGGDVGRALPSVPFFHRAPQLTGTPTACPATPSGRRCRLRTPRGPAPATVARPGDTDVTSRRDGGCGAHRQPGLPPRFIHPEPN